MGWFASSLADICMLSYQWRNIMTIKQIGIDISKLVRRWWWKDENDAVFLQLRYGNRPIVVADKNSTIGVGSLSS